MDNEKKILAIALLASLSLAACGFQTYSPQPIAAAASAARYRAHDPDSAEFHAYLLTQGYDASQLPFKSWGLRELTLSALFFHPQLDVARAQWRAAQAAEITAAQRPGLGLSGSLDHHSRDNGGSTPWTYGLAIDIPIVTADKRQIQVDIATQLSEAARIAIAQSAWQLRNRLQNSLIDYYASLQQAKVLQQEVDLRSEIVAMLDKRLSLGVISSVEISNPRLQLQKAQQALQAEQARASELRAALAANTGLPLQAFSALKLDFHSVNQTAPLLNEDLQTDALLNRLDIRASLARYAVAEARLRLEIARQYPDFTLSPGFTFDQGDRIWSLGWSTLLTLLRKNAGLIGEARALRDVEAAQFDALQAQVISDLEQTKARYQATLDELAKTRSLQTAQQARARQIDRQFNAGFADRLEFASARLENLLAKQNVLAIETKLQRAASALENVMQRPLQAGATALPEQPESGGHASQ